MKGRRLKTLTKTCKCCHGTGQEAYLLDNGQYCYREDICEVCAGEGTVETIKSDAYHLAELGPMCVHNAPPLMEDIQPWG